MGDAVMRCDTSFRCTIKPSVESVALAPNQKDAKIPLGKEPKKNWEISGHCENLLFPSSHPDIAFCSRSANFYFQRFQNDAIPTQELVHQVRGAYYRVLAKLNQTELQVKNFILPVQLLKLKYVDPYSRQRIVEGICNFLSSQTQLRSVVLEQAGVSFADFCRLLLAITRNSLVKRLYAWDVLDKCDIPFKGPLQSVVNLDDLPRIPFTYNPGGRKYLKQLEKLKQTKQASSNGQVNTKVDLKAMKESKSSLDAWIESLIEDCLKVLSEKETNSIENVTRLIDEYFKTIDQRDFVFTQMEVGVQCESPRDTTEAICHIPVRSNNSTGVSNLTLMDDLLTKTKIDCCRQFLKIYENSEIRIGTLRQIYKVALNGLINLTKLSTNYGLLADGTGETLMSIGSVPRGKLRELELLCEMKDIPSENSKKYDKESLQALPDETWTRLEKCCPDLKVGMVCLNMSTNEVTKMFITRSIPLNTIHFDNGFCPTLVRPQIMFFKTLRSLSQTFHETLEHFGMVFWHSSGKLDSSLEYFIRNTPHLRSFEYLGPIVHKDTISKLCDAALRPLSELISFKLTIQGDPCFPEVAKEVTADIYQKYLPRFYERSIQFKLGSHIS